jgi:two-component system, NtrC family, sensor kinase
VTPHPAQGVPEPGPAAPVGLLVPVLGRGGVAARVVAELREHLEEVLVRDGPDVATVSDGLPAGHVVPLVLVVAGEAGTTAGVLEDLATADAPLSEATVLVVTDHAVHDDLSSAVDRGRLVGLVAASFRDGHLAAHARSHVARWLRRRDVETPAAWKAAASLIGPEWAPDSDLLQDLELDDRAIAARLSAALDAALGPRPRLRLRAGTRLTRQDVEVNGVFVVRSGAVALDRVTEVGEVRLHHRSTGPVVGLLSLAQQRRAFFTARATTDVEVLHLTVEQLDVAVHESPAVAAALAAGAVRALAARLRRAEQLQVEKRKLNLELEDERRRLSDAYDALETARLELVEQARFATLGELAAGVAHELNNPVAALTRAASFVAEDVVALLATHPEAEVLGEVLAAARTRPPSRPADERAARRVLTDALGDAELARRLAAAGLTDPERARQLLGHRGTRRAGSGTVELVERAAGLGTAVRNLELASTRIGELVASLRSYARPDLAATQPVDVHTVLEDTLRLVAHRLGHVEVVRDYGDLPVVHGHPGQLGQVWTNLLVNAAEAVGDRGRLEISTRPVGRHRVRVTIADDGPGIPPAERERIFEPRFTTKDGTVRYGLGLGLPIARRLVEGHHGTIRIDSGPGGTVATVELPVTPPPDPDHAEPDRAAPAEPDRAAPAEPDRAAPADTDRASLVASDRASQVAAEPPTQAGTDEEEQG